MTGVLFLNSKKTSENHPNMQGWITIEGKKYWAAGWTNYKRKNGEKYLNLVFKSPDETSTEEQAVIAEPENENDLPF